MILGIADAILTSFRAEYKLVAMGSGKSWYNLFSAFSCWIKLVSDRDLDGQNPNPFQVPIHSCPTLSSNFNLRSNQPTNELKFIAVALLKSTGQTYALIDIGNNYFYISTGFKKSCIRKTTRFSKWPYNNYIKYC